MSDLFKETPNIDTNKMNRIVFDFETTGKANFRLPANHETQPRIVQMAYKVKDSSNRLISQVSVLIKPEGWVIPQEATDIHGITTEDCNKFGIPLVIALALFNNACRTCEARMAHNIRYDDRVAAGEFMRAGREWIGTPKAYCTMQLMTPVCRIPNPKFPGFKWPSLEEAFEFCFGHKPEDQHDAMGDVISCDEIYMWHRINKHPLSEATYK